MYTKYHLVPSLSPNWYLAANLVLFGAQTHSSIDWLKVQINKIELVAIPFNEQVEVACKQIAQDPRLQRGYNAIGYSQVLSM